MKVIINRKDTPFRLSDLAIEKLIERGWKVTELDDGCEMINKNAYIVLNNHKMIEVSGQKYSIPVHLENANEIRSNKDLVEVVELLGQKAFQKNDDLKVVEIPDNVEWYIELYKGLYEVIREKHQMWW